MAEEARLGTWTSVCRSMGGAALLVATVGATHPVASGAQTAPQARPQTGGAPWFGVPLPPGLTPHALEVISVRPAAPAVVPRGEERFSELEGSRIRADLETIVGFAKRSRETREVGDGLLWGRITGLPSGTRTVEWAGEELRRAGIADVELQRFAQAQGVALALPLSWEVRLLGSPAFGAGSRDVLLESAMPLTELTLPGPGLTAPLVHVGTATVAELAHIDVRGKIAVQRATPQGHTVFIRNPVGPRAEDLIERGAVAVLTIIDLPGNARVRDMGCGEGVCFNLGGRDGRFLERVMEAAAASGRLGDLRVSLRLRSEDFSGLSAENAVAVIPGTLRPDEYVVVNAHADAWFDGAGDNGDGLAVMLALARHFARPDMRQERSLVFVASAGHHTPGLSGPGNFVAMNQDLMEGAVLVVNLEHTAQRHITPARSEHPDGYREWTMDAHEAPIVAGITNGSQLLEGLVSRGIERYGTNFVSGPNPMASGEGGSYVRAGAPVFTVMQGPPMYHTTGEVLEMVAAPGLERMARFMAYFIEEVSRAPAAAIDP